MVWHDDRRTKVAVMPKLFACMYVVLFGRMARSACVCCAPLLSSGPNDAFSPPYIPLRSIHSPRGPRDVVFHGRGSERSKESESGSGPRSAPYRWPLVNLFA